MKQARKQLPDLSRCPVIACDGETTGLQWWKDELFSLAFAWQGERDKIESVYVDIRNDNERRWAKDQLKRAKKIVNHNIKFDAHFLREAEIPIDQRRIECTMIREALLDEHRYEYSLDGISKSYGLEGKNIDIWPKMAEMFGGKPTRDAQIANLHQAPESLVSAYARPDAELALGIWFKQEGAIAKQELQPIALMEHRLLNVIIDMEHRGTPVNMEQAAKTSLFLEKQLAIEQAELNKLAGWQVNVNSGPQVIKIVKPAKDEHGNWRSKDGIALEPTDSGGPSIRTHALHNMTFREAELIASIRGMVKAKQVFIDKYILTMSHNGRIHATINQTKTQEEAGTITGRLSITDPALQQIHKRDKKMAAIVRSLFIPDQGQTWGSYDWSQMDFRMFAHYVKSPILIDAYAANAEADFHSMVSEIVGVPRDRDQKTGGANAKQINLALVFGMGQGRLAREMGLPYYVDERGYFRAGEQAEAVFKKYHTAIPGVRGFTNGVESVAKARGHVLTPLGRRLHFPRGHGAHKAAGLLFQGAAADALKIKMIEMHDMLKGTESRLMLTVHDEFNISQAGDVPPAKVIELLQRFDGERTPMKFRVPILSVGGQGPNWWIACQ